MESNNPKFGKRKTKKACTQCKLRKKKCTGELPCGYCIKVGKGQNCEYRARHSSKTVKVTLRYLTSLKTRIRELENKVLRNSARQNSGKEVSEIDPLIDSDCENAHIEKEGSWARSEVSDDEWGKQVQQYMGDSSCFRFLTLARESLIAAGLSYEKISIPKVQLSCLEVSTDFFEIECLIESQLPSIEKALYLINRTEEVIGADYVYIEPDYSSKRLTGFIYSPKVSRDEIGIIQYVTEMARFYSYLALGSLFEHESNPPKFPGLPYFKTALLLQDYLLRAWENSQSVCMTQTYLYLAFYSLSLDKIPFAFAMVGIAVRMTFSLGFHKKTTTFAQNRVFWLCFIYDRLLAIRVGLPSIINESDIEVPLLDENNGTLESISINKYYFSSHVKLAKITTSILSKIYTKNSKLFINNCCEILESLEEWLKTLPHKIKLDYDNIKTWETRSMFNLHLNYNYSIMMTTRPVLLYVFKKTLDAGESNEHLFSKGQLKVVNGLLEACTQAAEIQIHVLTTLFQNNRFSICSFLDCHFLFSATVILILRVYCQTIPSFGISYNTNNRALLAYVESSHKVLLQLSNYNIVASNFNRQITEFIKLTNSKGALDDTLKNDNRDTEYIETPLSNYQRDSVEALYERHALDPFTVVDVSQLLNDISNNDPLKDVEYKVFDDDFLKYFDLY